MQGEALDSMRKIHEVLSLEYGQRLSPVSDTFQRVRVQRTSPRGHGTTVLEVRCRLDYGLRASCQDLASRSAHAGFSFQALFRCFPLHMDGAAIAIRKLPLIPLHLARNGYGSHHSDFFSHIIEGSRLLLD